MLLQEAIGYSTELNIIHHKYESMLNPVEIDNRLMNMAEAVKCEVLYDMNFKVDHYEFFSLKFQKEIQLQDFLQYFAQ